MKKIIILSVASATLLLANSYDNYIEDLSRDMRSYVDAGTPQAITKQLKEVKKSNKLLTKEVKEVKYEVHQVKKEVHTISKEIKSSNKDLIKEVRAVKKAVTNTNLSQSHGKGIIPVAMVHESTSPASNSFIYVGFGFNNLSVQDENGYFGTYALDDSAIDIQAGYGQYFDIDAAKLFATGGFEYLSLEQSDMKAITVSINTETNFTPDIKGYVGLKTGLSYLVWDIKQYEAVESITSTSPLIGIQAGIEYKFNGGVSLVLGGQYTKYFHETQIPRDTLKTNSSYGLNISLKLYQ